MNYTVVLNSQSVPSPVVSPRIGFERMSEEILKTTIDGFDAVFTREIQSHPDPKEWKIIYHLEVQGDVGLHVDHPFDDQEMTWQRVSVNDLGISQYVGKPWPKRS